MATYSYSDNMNSRQASSTAPKKERKVGYFQALKNDGDEAVVRFNYNLPGDFKYVTVHNIQIGDNKFRNVSCLKETSAQDNGVCPFCQRGDKPKYKVFFEMLVYSKDEAGNVMTNAVVWERPSIMIKEVVSAAKDGVEDGYYPAGTSIRDMIFKIKRLGAKGDRGTSYRAKALNPNMYSADVFKPDFKDFEGFDVSHHSYMVKTAEEIETYFETGEFPKPVRATDNFKGTATAPTPAEKPSTVFSDMDSARIDSTRPTPTPSYVGDSDLSTDPNFTSVKAPAPTAPAPTPAPVSKPAPTSTTTTGTDAQSARPKRTYIF